MVRGLDDCLSGIHFFSLDNIVSGDICLWPVLVNSLPLLLMLAAGNVGEFVLSDK